MLHAVLISIPDNDRSVPGRERMRRQREAAAQALDESARRTGLPVLRWERDAAGVPVFEQGVCWSLSHKTSVAAGVVATRPVGIDVEVIEPRNPGLWEYVASAREQTLLPHRDWATFFRLWTAKEAVLKANRVGLSKLDACRLVASPTLSGAALTFEQSLWLVTFFASERILTAVAHKGAEVAWHRA
ncbi:MAG: 4'-phosphopantetheinyl transferase superfamily protein [Phycisphaerae bacterium]|nr:MAG: 4'-phosphopantetheinyl transferase superfamily protein [Planctomycetota bacterium]KAB2938251.1 MAG: 4'-phosphopantetheinyl transferase superfamily protein [Phycisphaerae bacterium]MBE7455013.1 4'-phosphopantetheinyl transferase superfamily protein [Planctomycetia bacterium]MCK6464751.1 4'-phosphopantetheinyl transferase superfamily protein [Phycisphaerae bacterium]MCL4718912.1 4'-phosphopantetheinyl transferase superfamily protein [Phycisphaerae bacterium]